LRKIGRLEIIQFGKFDEFTAEVDEIFGNLERERKRKEKKRKENI
jgi:hypothetical protein